MERTSREPIVRIAGEQRESLDDELVVEEPLEIRVGDKPLSVTMRTPGEDFALAAGFLFTESVLHSADEIDAIRHWGSPNVVRVALANGVRIDWQRLQRHFYSTSSCGVCGKTSIDAVRVQTRRIESELRVDAAMILRLPELLRERQTSFAATGGLHGAGLFDAAGTLLEAAEDVGRHNAVDKVIGAQFLARASMSAQILAVSGRAGFEIVQKAIVAGIPIVAAVGAPSSLAVQLARDLDLTLVGFVRDGRFNIYSGASRIR